MGHCGGPSQPPARRWWQGRGGRGSAVPRAVPSNPTFPGPALPAPAGPRPGAVWGAGLSPGAWGGCGSAERPRVRRLPPLPRRLPPAHLRYFEPGARDAQAHGYFGRCGGREQGGGPCLGAGGRCLTMAGAELSGCFCSVPLGVRRTPPSLWTGGWKPAPHEPPLTFSPDSHSPGSAAHPGTAGAGVRWRPAAFHGARAASPVPAGSHASSPAPC